jgi:nucleoside-diphosphate-sugar epimerase
MEQPVAITGATGFVGGHLLNALLDAGHRVRVLVRDARRLGNQSEQVEIVEGDLDNVAALKQLVLGAKAVVHCAGAIAALNEKGFFSVNEAGSENVARASVDAGIENFILVSSLAAREPQLSFYAASKRAGEDVVRQLISKEHLTIIRPPAVYGPGDQATKGLIKALTQNRAILPGRADQKISWIYVTDLTALLAGLVERGPSGSDVLEIDDGHKGGYSFADLAQLAGKVQGKKITVILLPHLLVKTAGWGAKIASRLLNKAFILSPEKVNELYHRDWVVKGAKTKGWTPKIQFEEGFALALAWYRENGWLPGGPADVKSQRR